MTPTLASVVLPVYNQADCIAAVLQEYSQALAQLPFPVELLPVVNGPRRDTSLEICRELSERDPRIRTVCIDLGGWGRAVRAGLAEARGDLLCYTNSARTTAQDLFAILHCASIQEDAVIKAERKIRENWTRRLGSVLYNLECRSLFDLPYWDVNGTPKAFNRRFARLLALKRDDDLIDLEFTAICRTEGYRVLEVPIFSTSRRSGRSTTSMRSAVRMYWGALRMRREWGPN